MKKYYLNDDETLNFSSREDFQSYIDYRKETDEWKLHFINTLACFCTEKQLNYFKKNIDCPLADLKNYKKYANLMEYAEKQYICEDIEEIFYLTPEGDWRLVQVTEDGLKEYLFDNIDPAEVSAEEMYNAYYNSHLDITVKPELTYKGSHLLPCIQLFEDNTKILYCFRDQLDEIKNTDLPLENISLESFSQKG